MAVPSTTHTGNDAKAARVAASILWVLVIIALAYGIFNTAKTAVELFV